MNYACLSIKQPVLDSNISDMSYNDGNSLHVMITGY